jgi:hypothetical protein
MKAKPRTTMMFPGTGRFAARLRPWLALMWLAANVGAAETPPLAAADAAPSTASAPASPPRRSARALDVTWNEPNRCAMARVMRQGVRHQKNFSLATYGTREAAETAAAAWVRTKIRELPPELPRKDRMTSRNRSGVVGVWLVPVRFAKPDGRRYEYWRWTANWPGCAHRGGVSWYVHQYGDDDAFVLAVLSRRMETVDRPAVLAEFDRIDGTPAHDAILARRAAGPDPAEETPPTMDDEAEPTEEPDADA